MPTVSTYWGPSFWKNMQQALAWLYGRQTSPAGGQWLANALFTQGAQEQVDTVQPSAGLVECGLTSLVDFLTGLTVSGAQESAFAMSQIESIVCSLPPGYSPDNLLGPDGYPINESGIALPWGALLVNSYEVTSALQGFINTLLFNASASAASPGDPNTVGVIAKWARGTFYPFGSLIVDHNNNIQMALLNGVTEDTTSNHPTWPTSPAGGFTAALTGDGTQIWKLLCTGYMNQGWIATGYVWNLLMAQASYRVDVFVNVAGTWYFQGSSALEAAVNPGGGVYSGAYTWSLANMAVGQILAVLYPASVAAPSGGWSGSAIPAGWVSHSNTGVCQVPQASSTLGGKLANYKAQVYELSAGVETLIEDDIPIIVQSDGFHARAGSSVYLGSGAPAFHVLYDDPVVGWTQVFDSLETDAEYADLPRSYDVPTSDPQYVPNPSAMTVPAKQNRSAAYDAALAIIAYSAAGNFTAADKIIQAINDVLENPLGMFSPLEVLETAEDGLTSRWSASGTGATITNKNASAVSPLEPPFGTGKVLDFHCGTANGVFTFTGSGFPTASGAITVSFEHLEAPGVAFAFDVEVSSTSSLITDIVFTSDTGAPSMAGTVITVPIGPGTGQWRLTIYNLFTIQELFPVDTITMITGFKVTLTVSSTDLYFDNLLAGDQSPAGLLNQSYDAYNGETDQLTLRTVDLAWMVYAYSVYTQLSQDLSSNSELYSMAVSLLGLLSSAADLTVGLGYYGYGKYSDPGYVFTPGEVLTCYAKDQAIIWFALMRGANAINWVAINAPKVGIFSRGTGHTHQITAASCQAAAATLWTNLLANLYIAPSGGTPGHFAQGVTGSTLDTSENLEAQTWCAMLADANGRDDIALQCLEFAYQKFLLTNQTIALSASAGSYNEEYSLATAFSGMKPFNDSAGGYLGSPAAVSQEATWSFILALIQLYSISGLDAYFTGLSTTIDAVITALVNGQAAVLGASANGALLAYALASVGLPYEFEVWPALAPTAWMWVAATNPALLLTVNGQPSTLPYLCIPQGAEQSIDDKNGSSSIGQMEIYSIDPGGLLHTLAAQEALIGQIATFSMGFPGIALGDFTHLHVLQIKEVGFSPDGRVILKCADLKRFVQGAFVWANGGPLEYLPGQKNTYRPSGAQWISNSYPVSSDNPRWVGGNPLDIFLAAMQNELGVGQDLALNEIVAETGSGELVSTVNPFWAQYLPASYVGTQGNPATLINPNPFLDVPGIIALRDGMFSGDWLEFKITSPQQGRSWLEEQILKPLGLVMVVLANGKITLKAMRNPINQTPVASFTPRNIIGIPQVSLAEMVNALTLRLDVDETATNIASRTYNSTVSEYQPSSFQVFKYLSNHQVESSGLKMSRGGYLRAFLLGDQIFRRYAFAAPVYDATLQLAQLSPELKDWVSFTHPLVPDYIGGGRGVQNVPCEIIGRSPDYASARMRFKLLDMRRVANDPYVAALASGEPAYPVAYV